MSATVFSNPPSTAAEPTLSVAAGRVLVLAGAVFGCANLFQFAAISGLFGLSPAALSLSWPAALVVFFVVLFRLRKAGGANGRRTAVWSRMAIGFQVVSALTLLGVSVATHDFSWMYWTSPLGLMVYGLVWFTAAIRGRRGWMVVPALGALCAAGVVISLLGTAPAYLAYACGLFAFVFIPGVVLALSRN